MSKQKSSTYGMHLIVLILAISVIIEVLKAFAELTISFLNFN